MSLFSFLSPQKAAYVDKVWRTRPAAVKGMITQAMLAISQNQVPVILSYFEDKIVNVISFLSAQRVPYFHVNNNTLGEAVSQSNVVFICNASLLSTSTGVMGLLHHLSSKSKIQLLFDGHYPLPSRESKIIDKLSSDTQCTITFCSSIDEPSFKAFGTVKMMSLLDQLGMGEHEFIEHALVSKAMTRAREKIESMVPYEIAVETEEEWFLKNVKQ